MGDDQKNNSDPMGTNQVAKVKNNPPPPPKFLGGGGGGGSYNFLGLQLAVTWAI